MTHPYFDGAPWPRVLAHRGLTIAEGEDPSHAVFDNSALAIAAAHACGVAYIETDCRRTADGDVVLFHDADLSRLFGDPRPVASVRTAELAALFAEHGGLLTLREALESFPTLRFNIDVKDATAAEAAGAAVSPHAHRVLLTSFSDATRRRAVAAAVDAGAEIAPAASPGRSGIARARALAALPGDRIAGRVLAGIDALQIPVRYERVPVFSPSLVRAARAAGVEVHVWTINEAADMAALVAAGADGVVTDRADLALRVLAPS
ncbi:glycerophosphodiester phosphodiesterase family protein [Microbacterium resistens]|uniref:glycerophosphodiester phosphodiesterase family protein n=1 Tax=Microbacterium resistens TaxID=156977 RepID=UPI00082E7518|nr:glycerophosphodiester phosphodiesterase family protein [Microbacterium resistens]